MGSGHLFQTLIEENTAYDHEVYMIIALQLQLDIYTTIRRREKYSAKAVSVDKFSRERP